MKNSEISDKKYQCPSCRRFLPATLEYVMLCDECKKWICYDCLKENPCDFSSLHTICPECATRIRVLYRLPIYLTRCYRCAQKYARSITIIE